jgi:hypothetical protein
MWMGADAMNTYAHARGLGQAGQNIMAQTGNVLIHAAPLTGPAAPFVALAGSITELLAAIGVGKGCGTTCIEATSFANQAEVLLQNNLATYMSLPTPRTQSQQAAALANFDQIWLGLRYACAGVPGTAGQNCVADRQAGACKWRDASGNCFNWFSGYRDSIANDAVVPDAPVGTTAVSAVTGPITQAEAMLPPHVAGLLQNPGLLLALGAVVLTLVVIS